MKTDVEEQVEESTEIVERLAPLWRVICHDDPITTMDFVVQVLTQVFRVPLATATEIMLRVHYTGSAVVGLWPEEVARRKANRARAKARAASFPLAFTVEPDA